MSARDDVPVSEQYRLLASDWVDAEAAADLLEQCKSSYLARSVAALGDMPVNRAEATVKASPEWESYIEKMVEARKRASHLKVECEYLRMRHSERQSEEATRRAESRL